jgi:signal transduction histidine kinase/DNA-binding response OmpR family regulator
LKFITKSIQLGNKVVIGFVLATFLVASVSLITYYSILNLLDTVENLSEPNEKLQQLNGLLADVYLLDMSKAERTSDKDSVLELAINRIKSRLDWLEENSTDTTENRIFSQIGLNISELLVVYAGLEEITLNLNSRNFSEEALQNVERRIKRQQQLSEAQFLGGLSNRDLFSELRTQRRPADTVANTVTEVMENLDEEFQDVLEEDLIEIVKDLEELRAAPNTPIRSKAQSDSALLAIRNFVADINKDERGLRKSFSNLENRLLAKNKEVFFQIQSLISSMQQDVLKDYRNQNASAYNLTYMVSGILAFLVFLGVIGSLGFVYSILKEVKKADTYRKQLEEAKQQSDNLAKAKQDFLANMSHEIRNPLHAIAGFQQALNSSGLNAHQQEFVKMIGFASSTLMAIVNDILDFSKLEAGKIQIESIPFDPLKLFLSIKGFFSFKASEKEIGFDWDINLPEGKWLEGDALRINQILNNLISNGIKFTEKGSVNVTVTFREEGILFMEVKDTGHGIKKETLANIFQEFNQGDTSITRKFGGTGLGLAIVKKLVDLQKGTITVSSEEQVGTSVQVILPVSLVDPLEEEVESGSELTYSVQGLEVLVVDDDPINLKLIELLLESKGARVSSFLGGAAFQGSFKTRNYDVALLDIQMPQVSGMEVLDQLRRMEGLTALPVIAMTANVFANERNAILEAGFDAILLKPFNEDALIRKIGEILNLREEVNQKQLTEQKPILSKPYDLTDLKGFCMGDEELLTEIVTDLIQATENDLVLLSNAADRADFLKIREITHQLSSRMGQIRVEEGKLAKTIEVDIKNGQTSQVIEATYILIEKLSLVMQEIQPYYPIKAKS